MPRNENELTYEFGDFDSRDTYTIVAAPPDADGLRCTIRRKGKDLTSFVVTPKGLEGAHGVLTFAQDHLSADGRSVKRGAKLSDWTAPFLVPRRFIAELLEHGSSELNLTSGTSTFERDDQLSARDRKRAKDCGLPLLKARDDQQTVLVSADPSYPLLVLREFGEPMVQWQKGRLSGWPRSQPGAVKPKPAKVEETPAKPAPKGWPKHADSAFADLLIAAAKTLVARKPAKVPSVVCKGARASGLRVAGSATYWYNDQGMFRHTTATQRIDDGSEWHIPLGVVGDRALWCVNGERFSGIRGARATGKPFTVLESTKLPSRTLELAGSGEDIFLIESKTVMRVRDGKLQRLAIRPSSATEIVASRDGMYVIDQCGNHSAIYVQAAGATAFEKIGGLSYPRSLTVTDDGIFWIERVIAGPGNLGAPDVLVRWRRGDHKPQRILWAEKLLGLGADGSSLYVLFETSDADDDRVTLLLRVDHDGNDPQVVARVDRLELDHLVVGNGVATMTRGDDVVRVPI